MSIDAQLTDGSVSTDPVTSSTDTQTQTVSSDSRDIQASADKSEGFLPQSKVNQIVGNARRDAYEKAKRDALAEYQRTSQQSTQSQDQSASSMGGMTQVTPERLEQMIQEATDKRARESYASKVATDFIGKMEAGKSKYSDFEDTVNALNLPMAPEIVDWANGLDNTADVVYEIAKNPTKFTTILNLARGGFGQLAQRELQKLSESIKTNQQAADTAKSVNEPLTQIRTSTVGTDNGKMTVKDQRRQSWLRA